METVVSGIRSTGNLHLGNYFGAMKNFIKMQQEYNCYFFIADYHSLTTHPNPQNLHLHVKNVLVEYLAAGIDPEQSTIYVQSDLPEIAELYLLLNMNAYLGELERCTSFKDKIIEVVPNFFQPYQELKDQFIYLRLDYGFDASSFMQWCQWSNVSIISDKLIPLGVLDQIYFKVKNISFIINEKTNLDDFYIKYLKSKKINFQILVKDENLIPETQEKYFEIQVRPYKTLKKEDMTGKPTKINNTFFSSNKTILSNGKRYPSKYHWQKDENIIDKNLNIVEDDVFYEELNHYFIYERI